MQPHPFDVYVGSRIRLARLEARLNQTELANMLEITFQQVQKYEKGTNRTSCSRLYEISKALNKPLAFFLEGYDETPFKWSGEGDNEPTPVIDSADSLGLLVAFKSIDSRDIRKSIVTMTKAVAQRGEMPS